MLVEVKVKQSHYRPVKWRVVGWSVAKCGEVWWSVVMFFWFFFSCFVFGCMFCILLFNSVSYVMLLLCLYIVIITFMYFYCYVYVFLLLRLCIVIVTFMYSYCYVYVFLLLRLCILVVIFMYFYWHLCSVLLPTGILRLPWLRFFRAFSSVVRQTPGYTSQRRGTARTLPK
jgi:hypothetical protein